MTTLREAALMALDALNNLKTREPVDEEIAVLRAALASQTVPSDYLDSHQPDSWRTEARNELGLPVFFCASEVKQAGPGLIPLYTALPRRKPLTDEEIVKVYDDMFNKIVGQNYRQRRTVLFARAIERAHGIGSEV